MVKTSSPTLAQTERLLNLVPFIATHQNVAISELSKEFGVSKKEILDDLNTLWMCGLPGYTPLELIDLTFDDGFVSIRNAEILQIPRSLTTSEIVALILGLDLLLKADHSLKNNIGEVQEKLRKISGDIARAIPLIDSAYRAAIQQGIYERKGLLVTYFSPVSDLVTTREVTPLEIRLDGSHEYLVAMTDRGLRNFRLDRISAISIMERLRIDSVPSPESQNTEMNVRLKILSDFRRMTEILNIENSGESDMALALHDVAGFSSEWFVRTVMSGAGALELVEPNEMRDLIATRTAQLLEIYESGDLPK